MSSPEFPPNSEASKREPVYDKAVERVTTGEVTRRKKPLRKQLSETFVGGDLKSTASYVIFDVLLPAAKDMIVEAGSQGIEKLIFGDSRRRGATPPQAGPMGYVNYQRMTSGFSRGLSSPQRALSRQARARHNFDEIVLEERSEAENVIDKLFDLVSQYATASVADLYELVGLPSVHTDHKWGWSNLAGAGVSRVRGGYLLDLPDPHPID
jgi:hypothetical protein